MVMPDQMTRGRRAGGARREPVLDAVVAVLAERGYEHSRFADVAAVSGVAISTLQNYFGSREDMLVEALWRASGHEVAAMNEVASATTAPWDRLVALIDRSLGTPAATRRMLMEFWRAAMRDEELRGVSEDFIKQYRAPFLDTIRHGRDTGAFTLTEDPHAIADLLLATLAGAILPAVLGHSGPTPGTLRRVLLGQLAATLGIPGGKA